MKVAAEEEAELGSQRVAELNVTRQTIFIRLDAVDERLKDFSLKLTDNLGPFPTTPASPAAS